VGVEGGAPAWRPGDKRERALLTLAVLNGSDLGKILRTAKSRVTVGAAPDNDFTLADADIAPHHLVITLDDGGWRAEAHSADQRIVIDRRWIHPATGRAGGLIYVGGTELLVYPGELDEPTIQREIRTRRLDRGGPSTDDMNREPTRTPAILTPSAADAPTPERGDRGERGDPSEPKSTRPRAMIGAMSVSNSIGGRAVPVAPSLRTELDELVHSAPTDPGRAAMALPGLPPRAPGPPVPEVLAEPESRMRAIPRSPAEPPRLLGRGGGEDPRSAWVDPGRNAREARERAPRDPKARNAWGDAEPARSGPPPRATDRELDAAPQRPLGPVGSTLTVAQLAEGRDPALTVLREPDSDYAHAIRVLGTRLEELIRTYGYRAYMVTSPEPLTGKTTAAVNLAFALAEDSQRRVALIEANFRHPRIGAILGLPEERGLIGVLRGQLSVSEAIARFSDRNLVIFPSGGKHNHPNELLSAPRFKTLVAELAGTVDIAIIDAPSVRPFADANLLLPLVDGVLLCVLESGTHALWVDQVVDQLGRERILGALFNRLGKASLRAIIAARKERLESFGR
jgi:Mrp family chromosome partitioning ATPase